jgi:hypothetical protein
MIIFCDNVSAVYMTANPVHHRRTKHIEIDIHFVREKVALEQVRVLHVPCSLVSSVRGHYDKRVICTVVH